MSTTPENTATAIVETSHGPIRGIDRNGMHQYLGIPYAAPPLGDLRWRPPAEPPRWTQPLDAVSYGDFCAQNSDCYPGFGHTGGSEDCLYLNIFVSHTAAPGESLPVMIWIPAGGFIGGASTDYDPSALVRDGNVVFVSFNYRVNLFGFFSHPAINAEDHAVGNYGIMDQQAALRWVARNIAAFGGDPTNITIFGQSAGGGSVLAHLASPLSAGLFHKAIIQSASLPDSIAIPAVETLQDRGIQLGQQAGLHQQLAADLRGLSVSELMSLNAMPPGQFGNGRFNFGIMEDGQVVPRGVIERFQTGQFHQVPVIIGNTADEFCWFQAMIELASGWIISPADYPVVLGLALTNATQAGLISFTVPEHAIADVLDRYPVHDYPAPARALAGAIGDAGICTGVRRAARTLQEWMSQVYVYEFDEPDSPVAWPVASFPYGSAHTQELQYLFPLFCGGSGAAHPLSPTQQHLAALMVHYWTSFAWYGMPTAAASVAPRWQPYDPARDNVLLLHTPVPIEVEDWSSRHQGGFWDSFADADRVDVRKSRRSL
jgi:para-nitrobenzyl esterase